jgi:hypothetical protein
MFITLTQAISSTPTQNPSIVSSVHLAGVELLVRLRVRLRQPLRERREFGIRLIHGHARLERAEERGIVAVWIGARPRREFTEERQPQLLVLGKRESLFHDADDRRRLPVDADTPSDDVLRAAEVALPDAVPDDRHFFGAHRVVLCREIASENRLHPERRQEVFGDIGSRVALRLAVDRHVDRRTVQVGGQPLE